MARLINGRKQRDREIAGLVLLLIYMAILFLLWLFMG